MPLVFYRNVFGLKPCDYQFDFDNLHNREQEILLKMSAQMGNFEIKDGEYTKVIYSMIKEQR